MYDAGLDVCMASGVRHFWGRYWASPVVRKIEKIKGFYLAAQRIRLRPFGVNKRGGRRNKRQKKRHRPLFVYTGLVHVKKLLVLVLDRTRGGALKQGEGRIPHYGRTKREMDTICPVPC